MVKLTLGSPMNPKMALTNTEDLPSKRATNQPPANSCWALWGFLFLVGCEIAFFLYEVGSDRAVYHDGAVAMANQYYLINSLVQSGEVPLWAPLINHGNTMTWCYVLQGSSGFLMKAAVLLGGIWQHLPFQVVFFGALLVDRLVLLIGVWLLGGVYFRSALTRFLVCIAVMTSSLAYTQPSFNFYLFYCLPLVIFCGHLFLRTAQWRWLFMMAAFAAVQTVANCPYAIPFFSFSVCLYFGLWIWHHPWAVRETVRRLRWDRRFWAGMFGLLAIAGATILFLLVARESSLVQTSPGRQKDGTVSLLTFLAYAGNTDFAKWNELFLGVSPALDFTLYFGLLGLALAGAGFFHAQLDGAAVRGMVIALALVIGMPMVSAVLYHLWPTMKYFRHLALLAPLVKLWLCFLAGFGWERLLENDGPMQRRYFQFATVTLILVAVFLSDLAAIPELRQWLLASLVEQGLPAAPVDLAAIDLSGQRNMALAMVVLLGLFYWKRGSKRPGAMLITGLAAFWVADCYAYRIRETQLRTFRVPAEMKALFAYRPFAWVWQRDQKNIWADERKLMRRTPLLDGVLYCNLALLTRTEHAGTTFRTDFLQRSYWQYLQAYFSFFLPTPTQNPLRDALFSTKFYEQADLPISVRKISAIDEPKVQFFADAFMIGAETSIRQLMVDARYEGNQIFLQDPTADSSGVSPSDATRIDFAQDQRRHIPMRILAFTPNRLSLEVNNPTPKALWLFYSDAWHPRWRARVGAMAETVYRANLAYKAVRIPAGPSTVEFYFQDRLIVGLHYLFAVLALAGLAATAAILITHFGDQAGPSEAGRHNTSSISAP
jgi:hypothetical protein